MKMHNEQNKTSETAFNTQLRSLIKRVSVLYNNTGGK